MHGFFLMAIISEYNWKTLQIQDIDSISKADAIQDFSHRVHYNFATFQK